MRRFRIFILPLVIIATFCLNSCEIEPLDPALIGTNPNPGTNTSAGVFKVDFDGKTFVATTVQALVNNDYISISGLKTSTGELVQITLPAPFNEVGTYTWKEVSAAAGVMALAYNPPAGAMAFISADKNSVSGPEFAGYTDTAKITISKIDVVNGKMSGTFEFTGFRYKDPVGGSTSIETKKFTRGSFTDIPFTKDVVVTPNNNSFSAKMDGVAFTPTYINGLSSSGFITIVGRRGTIENIGLVFPNTIAPGTYNYSWLDTDFRGQYIKNNNADGSGIFGGDGSVTITSHDKVNKKIVGTFKFTANSFIVSETHNITDGTFSVSY
ncbi:DUF6252 family protein [Flavobacterium limnophilum]|uniref:DUF6252 family protein n=1 Tax=Flavobacterium limnophilum TaxID=3003262 RepID=UPI002483039C|nr:DUF6252 family protein [Flavobacterium limnophilum]